MAERTTVLVVGAPRSGTTFVQQLLGAHPDVVTSQETDLFDHYVRPLRERWDAQLPGDEEAWQRARHKGLPAVLTEMEFDQLVADLVERVHGATAALKPGAHVLLEKVPAYGRHGALILRYVPHARFIHVVRDGRDVTCSLVRAGRGWGSAWAPAGVERAAEVWRDFVVASRGIRELTEHYTEVRYEDLVGDDGPAEVERLLAFCGVEARSAEAAEIHAAASAGASALVWGGEVARRLEGAPDEPAGFAGEGGVGTWQRELSRHQRVLVERVAGRLLAELRYTTPGWTGVGRLGTAARLLGARQAGRVRHHAARIAQQVGR
jgi:hypothetical protein